MVVDNGNWQYPLDHRKSKIIPEKHLFLIHGLRYSLWRWITKKKTGKFKKKKMRIPDHLTYILRNLNAGQDTTVRTERRTTDWFKIGKRVHQYCILSLCYLTFMQSTTCKMLGWINHKLESRLPGEISANSDMQMMAYLPSNSRKQRGTKEPLDEDERGEWKSWLKTWRSKNEDHDIQSHLFMAHRRRINGSSDRFYFLEPPNHCSWWLQPWNKKTVAAWKESYDEPRQDVKKQRYNCADKGPYSQSYGFSSSHVQIWELDHKEGWAPQNWCFQTVVLEKTLEHLFGLQGNQTNQS